MRIQLRLLAAISSLIVACAHDAPPLRSQAPSAASPQESAHVNGADLRYVERGSGLPMVFVHGSLGGLETLTTRPNPRDPAKVLETGWRRS